MFRCVIAVILAAFLSSCGYVSGPKPETPQERLAALELTFQTALAGVSTLEAQGLLNKEADRRFIADLILTADDALTAANFAVKTNNPQYMVYMTTAIGAVNAVVNYVASRKTKKTGYLIGGPSYA